MGLSCLQFSQHETRQPISRVVLMPSREWEKSKSQGLQPLAWFQVFKTILLNFSPRDSDPPATPLLADISDAIDVPQLLAAHEQRRLATFETDISFSSSSSTSLSSHSSFSSLDSVGLADSDHMTCDWTHCKVRHPNFFTKEAHCLLGTGCTYTI